MAEKKRSKGMQIAIYDVGNNPLSQKVITELEEAVVTILQKHTTLAHTVVQD